jgi:hypothetical protein
MSFEVTAAGRRRVADVLDIPVQPSLTDHSRVYI